MKKPIYDENGQKFDLLSERNENIKCALAKTLDDFLIKESKDKTGRKRYGFMMLMQIEDELGKYGRLTADELVALTPDDVEDLWWHFHSLMAYYNQFFEIVPNRQSFMLYAKINSRQYKGLMESDDEDMRSVIAFIEDRLVGKGFSAGESGNANDKAIMNRLKSAEVGHNVVSATDDKIIKAVQSKSPLELENELLQILGGGDTKKLN